MAKIGLKWLLGLIVNLVYFLITKEEINLDYEHGYAGIHIYFCLYVHVPTLLQHLHIYMTKAKYN